MDMIRDKHSGSVYGICRLPQTEANILQVSHDHYMRIIGDPEGTLQHFFWGHNRNFFTVD